MANTSLPPHEDYPALPAQAFDVKPDSGCVDCPLAQSAGHLSCSTFRVHDDPEVPDTARINLKTSREMQGQVHRRSFDIDGIIASHNGANVDAWYYNNASKAINFANFSAWTVTGISGDTVTLSYSDTSMDADARRVLYAMWRKKEEVVGLYWINGFASYTAPQPLDMFQLQWPSKGCQLPAKILQITAATATTLTVKIDKDLSAVWNEFFAISDGEGGFEPDPESVSAKIYNYGRESESWFYVQEPHYFLGKRKQVEINVSDEGFPTDGLWQLETAIIAPPDSADPLVPNFVMEGWDGENWVTINESSSRLHIKPTLSVYSLKPTLPTGTTVATAPSDLTSTYERFRATYYVETGEEDPDCQLVGYDRCYYSRVDPSKSVGNFGATKGVGITTAGDHVFCGKRIYEQYEYVDDYNRDEAETVPPAAADGIPDKVNVTIHHPTGLGDYPTTTGKCIQYNFCNKYVNSINLTPTTPLEPDEPQPTRREAPFNVDETMRFLLELWFAGDKRRHQRYVLAEGPTGYVIERIVGPSIMWLLDYYGGMVTPGGFHERDEARGNGTWSVKQPITVTFDADGNQRLQSPSGLERGYALNYNETTEQLGVDNTRKGVIPDSVTDFTTMRDSFDPASTIIRDLLEYIGAQIERDSMQLQEVRGLSAISMALTAEDILIPNLDFNVTTLQQRTRSTFQMVDGNGVILVLPYRQDGKTEITVGTRTVNAQTSLGGGRWRLTFNNESKTFTRFDLGDLGTTGDSYDKEYSVMAGGGPVILPYEPQGLFSNGGEKRTGSRAAGAMPLDCLEVDGIRNVIDYVGPHEGAEAETWGNRQISIQGIIGGFYQLIVQVDEDDNDRPFTPLIMTSVIRTADSQAFTINADDARPAASSNTVWFDSDMRLYFSSANNGDFVEIKYDDSDDPANSYTQHYTVEQSFTVSSTASGALDYSEWTGADTKTIYIGSTAATIDDDTGGTLTPPPPGTARVNDNGGKIQLTFNVDDAPKTWKLVLGFDVEADPPEDDWAVGGQFTDFGKKMDVAEIRADVKDGATYYDTHSVVGSTATVYQLATVFLPKSDLVVMWTTQALDNWQTVDASYVTVEAARGKVVIDASWFTATFPSGYGTDKFCFKVVQIQMVDNRGQVPASILNKTEAVLDAMNWCITAMGSGFGGISYRQTKGKGYAFVRDAFCGEEAVVTDNPPTTDSSLGNFLEITSQGFEESAVYDTNVTLSLSSTSFGVPLFINNLPDGVEIVSAFIELTGGGITYYHETNFVQDSDPDALPSDISLVVLGFTSETSYEAIGSIAGAANGTVVRDVTELLQTMYATRKGTYVGFGLAFSPIGFGEGGGIEQFLPEPPEPTTFTSPECPGSTFHSYPSEQEYTRIDWTLASFGKLVVVINYNGKDKLDLLQPRFPAFVDLP